MLSAWKEEFQTTFSPAPGLAYAGATTLFFGDAAANPASPSLRELKQGLSDAATIERREVGRITALLNRVEADAQGW